MVSLFMASTNKTINRLADRSIRADRRRNVFIMTTIALASCLIMVLALLVYGGTYQINQFYRGRFQAVVSIAEPEQIAALTEDENIEQAGLTLTMRFKSLQTGKERLNVTYYDETAFRMSSFELIQGRLPEAETEIAIPSSYLEKKGIEAVLGQTISLDLGQNVPSVYTVCGLIRDEGADNTYEVLVSQALLKSYFSGVKIPYAVMIRMAGSEDMEADELKQDILVCMGKYGFDEADIRFSSSYFITYENVSTDRATTLGIGILIMIACSVVIYSLFYISVTEKVKEYGRLRVVGITQKQMKRLVQKESRKMSLFSIPLGIVCGCIIGYLLLPGGWYWPNTVKFAVLTAFVMVITVRLSIHRPVRIAMSVSPVEAARITTADAVKPGDTKKLTRRLTPRSLAKINFSRNRKRTVLTLFSLGFTGILLMCAAAVMQSVNPEAMAHRNLKEREFIVYLSPEEDMLTSWVSIYDRLQQNNPLSQDFIAKLTEEVQLRDLESVQSCQANLFFPGNGDVDYDNTWEIVGLSREYLESHQDALLSGTLDYDELVENQGIIIDDDGDMLKTHEHYEAIVGDSVQIENDEGKKVPFQVMATAHWEDRLYGGCFIFVPEDLLPAIKAGTTNFSSLLAFNSGLEDISQADDIIYEICGENPNLEVGSIVEASAAYEHGLKEYMRRIYAIVVFIGIFALINLSNTLMTGFVARQQELGMLRSIGLSNKQLAEMLRLEAFHYVLVTMAITLTVGTAAGYIFCRIFNRVDVFGEMQYIFPLLPVLALFAALAVIALGYSLLAVHYCEKKTLSEYVKGMT